MFRRQLQSLAFFWDAGLFTHASFRPTPSNNELWRLGLR